MESVKTTYYFSPVLEIVALDLSDIVTTSGEGDESGNGGYVSDNNKVSGW